MVLAGVGWLYFIWYLPELTGRGIHPSTACGYSTTNSDTGLSSPGSDYGAGGGTGNGSATTSCGTTGWYWLEIMQLSFC